jgi:Cu-processing system permease protein
MSNVGILLKYGLYNQLRNRWLIGFALFFFGAAYALLGFGGDERKAVASLVNIVILICPSVAILYSTVFWYASASFNHLLLMQPVKRAEIFLSTWLAIALNLSGALALGTVAAFVMSGYGVKEVGQLVLISTFLIFIFSAMGVLCSVVAVDRMRGLAAALGIWLYFSLIHDGIAFLVLMSFRDYPIEKFIYAWMAFNPIDLARLYLIYRFDLAALMGYTGSILQQMVGGRMMLTLFCSGLCMWIVIPALVTERKFRRSDL